MSCDASNTGCNPGLSLADRPAVGATLVLGIGNVLMGDEGIGVHIVRRLQEMPLPADVTCLDGGTGSFQLLGPMREATRLILVDATADGRPPGTVRRLRPRFSTDYPPSLTAHDIGLKDLLDAFHLLGGPEVVLFAVSIASFQQIGLDLSPEVAACVEGIAAQVRAEFERA